MYIYSATTRVIRRTIEDATYATKYQQIDDTCNYLMHVRFRCQLTKATDRRVLAWQGND